ncbi:OmpA family protein [Falsirhodobacter xinxiangensis]|uniref:OmpA family protein n=1 Tax=Falsirhodobacter xinxiangensis TaxID=2530049 RepID=UPI0010A9DF00|nr:OmpA family protein [Rhodobacter xinxiangensis]
MRLLVLALLAASPAMAFTPEFPGPSTVTLSVSEDFGSFAQPLAAWTEVEFPQDRVEGRITHTAWRIEPPVGFSTLSILAPIRDALGADGWDLLFECETDSCGGYDFRYRLDLFPEPEMHVDLGDFRYLSARKGAERISLMVSRTASLGFVQMVAATQSGAPATRPAAEPAPPVQVAGAEVLEGLAFDSGAATLSGDQPALQGLADWMRANPARRITLVGHTDASGALEANIAVSRQRAEAVRDWLVADGIDPSRIDAQGVGYLAPRDTNATDEGRARNRRVEVIRD